MRQFLRLSSLLFLAACASTDPVPVLVDGQPNEAAVLPVVMRELSAAASRSTERICVAQADDAFSEIARPFPAATILQLRAVDRRVSGDARDCGLRSVLDPLPAEAAYSVMIYYRNGARWMLEMAQASRGGDWFDRGWFNDYLQRFKSGHALIFVRVDRTVHFFEIEAAEGGPRIVGTEVPTVLPSEDPETGDLRG